MKRRICEQEQVRSDHFQLDLLHSPGQQSSLFVLKTGGKYTVKDPLIRPGALLPPAGAAYEPERRYEIFLSSELHLEDPVRKLKTKRGNINFIKLTLVLSFNTD